MQELTFEQVEEVSGGGTDEALCVAGFTYLGGYVGFFGGALIGGFGAAPGFYAGVSFGSIIGASVCLP